MMMGITFIVLCLAGAQVLAIVGVLIALTCKAENT